MPTLTAPADLTWRYATKKFDSNKKLSTEQLDELIEVLRLSPSSFGIQPWKFLIITDPQLREQLKPASWDQSQITDASHLIVFCVRKNIDEAYVDNYLSLMAGERGVPIESLQGYKRRFMSFPERTNTNWAKRQLYIALGFLLYACAQRQIDACPIEGFEPEKYNKILNLEAEGLEAVVICAIGYRSEEDKYAKAKKVRFPREMVIKQVTGS